MKKYLKRQMSIHEKNLKYDFLPSMIEIIEKPSNRFGIIIMFIIIFMIISSIIWAAFCKIDIVVTASGAAMPENGIITINGNMSGIIDEICVSNGESVKKGDVLFKLDSGNYDINYSEYEYNLKILQIQREMYGIEYETLTDDEQYNKEMEYDTTKYGENASIADAIILEHNLFVAKLDKIYSVSDKENARKEQMLNVLQNINTLDTKIEGTKLDIKKAENDYDNYEITAPCDGELMLSDSIYIGMSVDGNTSLAYIIPSDSENVFTVYVANRDIEDIHISDRVGIKIPAFDNTNLEYLEGEIYSIGDIALNVENKGSVYEVKIHVENFPDDIKIGLEGNCDIIIGERTVLDYFLEPFKEGVDSSLREK